MLREYRRKTSLILLISLLAFTGGTYSCEFHDGFGFGGPMSAGYGKWHSYRADNAHESLPAASESLLRLIVPAMIVAKMGEKTELNVGYEMLTEDNDIQLTLETAPGISTASPAQVSVSEMNGTHTFAVVPTQTGMYRLIVVATGHDGNQVKTQREMIYLRVVMEPA